MPPSALVPAYFDDLSPTQQKKIVTKKARREYHQRDHAAWREDWNKAAAIIAHSQTPDFVRLERTWHEAHLLHERRENEQRGPFQKQRDLCADLNRARESLTGTVQYVSLAAYRNARPNAAQLELAFKL